MTDRYGTRLGRLDALASARTRRMPGQCSWLCGLLMLFTPNVTNAQPPGNRFVHLSVEEGLSHNGVNCIFQDRQGFMWFATNNGLNRYDGYTFTSFRSDPAKPTQSFLHGQVSALCQDPVNRLWAVTEGGGLHEVNPQTGRVTPHPIWLETAEHWAAGHWNDQLSVVADHQGILWVSTYDGLARYDPARHHFTLYPAPQPDMHVKNALEDRQHRLWLATSHGLYQFDQRTGRYTQLAYSAATGSQPVFDYLYLDSQDQLWLASVGRGLFRLDLRHRPLTIVPYNPGGQINRYLFLNALHHDAQGHLWIGTTDGLQRVDTTTGQVTTYRPDPQVSHTLSGSYAQAVYHDRAGTLWVGTNNGIDKQSATTQPFESYQLRPTAGRVSLLGNRTNALLVDEQNQLWLSNHHDVHRLATLQGLPTAVPAARLGTSASHTNYTYAFVSDGKAGVWLGTEDGLYHYNQTTRRYVGYPSRIPARHLSRSPSGDIWLGGEGGLACFNPRTSRFTYYRPTPGDPWSLPNPFVGTLLASRRGDVWTITKGQHVSRLDPRTGRFTPYEAKRPGEPPTNDQIVVFHEDTLGTLWAGTAQGTLKRLDPRTNRLTTVLTRDDLPGNRIAGILSDRAGQLWLSTDNGLCRFNPRTRTIRHYNVHDGLLSNDFLDEAAVEHRGQLFFGTRNGLVYFRPERIRDAPRAFPVYVTHLSVLNKRRPLTDSVIQLRHDENVLSFDFVALTYGLDRRLRYAYQLVGVDENWVSSGNRHFASYANLAPGDYQFRGRAAGDDGLWRFTPTPVRLTIQPPWWATGWAYGLYVLLAGGLLYGFIQYRVSRLQQQQIILSKRRETEQLQAMDALKMRFFTNVAHEFRTPLTLILSPVEYLLTQATVPPAHRSTLLTVQRNAGRLLQLINQLLDLARLEAGRLTTSEQRGDLSRFVGELVDSFRLAAAQGSLSIGYHAEGVTGEWLFDADTWTKIVSNLLSNAIRHTPAGGRISVSLTMEPGIAVIAVTDTGSGMAPDQLPRIFDRFYQINDSRSRAPAGSGIGLALVKELSDQLGGSVAIRSEVGQGSTFTVRLPAQPADSSERTSIEPGPTKPLPTTAVHTATGTAAQDVTSTPATNDPAAPLVVVVEDNADLRAFLVQLLQPQYRVFSADNGQTGWELIRQELPDVALIDVMMPVLDGYELTRLIREGTATNHIGVILLTAKVSLDDKLTGLEHGASDYLTKPFHAPELHWRLKNMLNRQQALKAHYQRQLTVPNAGPATGADAFLNEFHSVLEAHLDDAEFGIDDVAEALAMSRRTLYRKTQALTGLTPNDVIRHYRLRRAAELLRAGQPVAQTAYQVGFTNVAYFSQVFKQVYHVTPSNYRLS